MNTTMGATAVSPETPLDKNPPLAADLAWGRVPALHDVETRIYSKAKREARYYGIDNPKDVEHLMESIRYREFRRAIEPYERFRNKPIFDWLALQTRPDAEQPIWLKENTALWDGLIAGVARDYGYTSSGGEKHGT